jgi:signal transduction histidine kinase
MYSVGYYAPRPWTERGLGIGVVGVVLVNATSSSDDVGSYAGTLILACVAPWLAGRVTAVWAQRARDLQRANERLRAEQERIALLAVSDERGRIARELHDVVAHSISVMVVQSEGAKRIMDRDPARSKQALEQIEATGRAALVEMRRLLGVLRKDDESAALAPQPGAASLDMLVDRAHEAGLDVDVVIEGQQIGLPAGVDVTVYRIIQEALTNTLKFAGPVHADVIVRYLTDEVEVEVVDTGPGNGFVPEAVDPENPQHGLLGMQERVKIYGGEVVAGPCEDAGVGYRVWARIPLGHRS